ncbi:hypothetical protein, partial [Methylocella sp.]|uniref:hypothetical protein n=1 Tax=Methylocella sp. TaxID=1978226 RepID=UPI0037839F36
VGSIDQPQLRAFADRNAVALVAVKGDPVQRGFYPPDLLDPYLERLGEMLHRPELATLPAITFGHSNGTGFSALIAALRPDRTIAWISYHPGATSYLQYPDLEKTPGLVMHGLADPFFSPEHEAVIAALRRERAAPLTFMIEPDVPHFPVDKGQNATFAFIAAYCEAALRIRLKPDGGLRPVVLENGWLGGAYDRAKGGRQRLSIAPYRAFVGDPSTATWLPDETFAEVWRRYGETDPRSP